MDKKVLYYTRVLIIGCIAGMHLAVMDMFKVAFKTFLEELGMIKDGNSTDIVLEEYSKIYSLSALLDIPLTMFWGYFTDRYGTKLSLNIQGFGTVLIFMMLSTSTTYASFFTLMVLSTVFDKYIIALDTFFGWLPSDGKISYIRYNQLVKSLMMQSGPMIGGLLTSLRLTAGVSHIAVYHRLLAVVMAALLVSFNMAFMRGVGDGAKRVGGRGWQRVDGDDRRGRDGVDDMDDGVIVRRGEVIDAVSDVSVNVKSVEVEVNRDEEKMQDAGIWGDFVAIWNFREARYLIFLGLYLRMAKKYVDYGFHLWAEIKREENGLGLNKFALGSCSSLGGITSVLIYFSLFSSVEMTDLPYLIKRSFLLISATVFCFPFLIFLKDLYLDIAVYLIILSFMINEALVFSGWIALINTCLPKSIRARSYSLALTIKGCIGFCCSYVIFAGFRWTLNNKTISSIIAPLNSIIFFWSFSGAGIAVFIVFKDMSLKILTDDKYSLTV